MKRNTIKKIASMLGTMSLFSNPVKAKFQNYDDDFYYDDIIDDDDIDEEDDNIENEIKSSDKNNVGLFSQAVNKALKMGGYNKKLNLSKLQEAFILLSSVIVYENIKSGWNYKKYDDNPFSAKKLDEAAAKEVGDHNKFEKLRWIIDHLHEQNSIKFGSIDALTIPKYPLFLLWKSKLLNLFVPKDRSTLKKNMEYSSTLYQTLGTAICADNAKILYLWAKSQNLPCVMVIEDVHCYVMIKIGNKWYRPEPLSPETEKWPRLCEPGGDWDPPNEPKDRKILLINPDKKLEEQRWEDIKVWDLDINNMPSWDKIYDQILKNDLNEGIPEERISGTKDLQWKIQWWY